MLYTYTFTLPLGLHGQLSGELSDFIIWIQFLRHRKIIIVHYENETKHKYSPCDKIQSYWVLKETEHIADIALNG
jgi:hypothetical protein